jgi:hypothetical protein
MPSGPYGRVVARSGNLKREREKLLDLGNISLKVTGTVGRKISMISNCNASKVCMREIYMLAVYCQPESLTADINGMLPLKSKK